jgi:dehydrogenase/reductase SDR family member 7B
MSVKKKAMFNQRVIWITGASSGIGEMLVYRFDAMGAKLVISSNEEEELHRVSARCKSGPDNIMVLPLDLSKSDEMTPSVEEVTARFGHVDYLFNNGGISQRSLAKDTAFAIDRKIMEIDYFGHIALTKAVLPYMLHRKSGHIVVTTSIAGMVGVPMRTAYCAAKHALHGFFAALAPEVWKDNIKITLVCPSAVKTRISKTALTGDGTAYGRMDNIISKGISPEACADQIISAVAKGRHEAIIGGGAGKYAVYAKRYLPSVYARLVRYAKGV